MDLSELSDEELVEMEEDLIDELGGLDYGLDYKEDILMKLLEVEGELSLRETT